MAHSIAPLIRESTRHCASQGRDGCNRSSPRREFLRIGAAQRGRPSQTLEGEHIMPNAIIRVTLVASALSIGVLTSAQAQDAMKKDMMKPGEMKSDTMKSGGMKKSEGSMKSDSMKPGSMKSDGMKTDDMKKMK
jgi:pentapeptide MXKDX repeat protein